MLNLDADKQDGELRREVALAKMRESIEGLAANVQKTFSVESATQAAQETIQRHPWLATGAALGVGFLATQVLAPIIRPGPAPLPPQRVVVELKQPDGSVVPTQAPPHPKGNTIRDLIVGAATAAFATVRPLLEKALKDHLAPAVASVAKAKPTTPGVSATNKDVASV